MAENREISSVPNDTPIESSAFQTPILDSSLNTTTSQNPREDSPPHSVSSPTQSSSGSHKSRKISTPKRFVATSSPPTSPEKLGEKVTVKEEENPEISGLPVEKGNTPSTLALSMDLKEKEAIEKCLIELIRSCRNKVQVYRSVRMPQLHTSLHFHLTPIVIINGSSRRDLLLNSQKNFCRSIPAGAENPSLSRLCYRRLWGSRNRRALILGWVMFSIANEGVIIEGGEDGFETQREESKTVGEGKELVPVESSTQEGATREPAGGPDPPSEDPTRGPLKNPSREILINMEANNVPTASEMFGAQAHIYKHTFHFANSMVLRCAIQLGIPDIIHSHKQPMTLSELVSELKLPPAKSNDIYRLMRLLVYSGFFATKKIDETLEIQEGYVLTASSKLLLKSEIPNLSPFVRALVDPVRVIPWQCLGDWFLGNEATSFETVYGAPMWKYCDQNPRYNKAFNEAMASDSEMMSLVVKDCRETFEELDSLVDVGGGTGVMAKTILGAFPHIKCTVLDLPHVVANMPEIENLKYVGGDMFQSIPPADAILGKKTLTFVYK
ncbi:trans-resveratrol di-o-methyltransferase [Nicotiana attenuata]|uniref:Trans-resveratrol di-o-methyltransferase n=1 Tax=Nicotiana attenuata TaxID=49451 RepID=A0A1J6ILJ2_NICAT|nr:trans-resveratrol di-o-methyltransferase [Nicotiana attenuata]